MRIAMIALLAGETTLTTRARTAALPTISLAGRTAALPASILVSRARATTLPMGVLAGRAAALPAGADVPAAALRRRLLPRIPLALLSGHSRPFSPTKIKQCTLSSV